MKASSQALKYEINRERNKMLIFFDVGNPVERGVASMLVKELGALVHKVIGTNLMYIEVELTNKILMEYEDFIERAIKDAKTKRGSEDRAEDGSSPEKGKESDGLKGSGKKAGINKVVRRKSGSKSNKSKPSKLGKGRRRRVSR